MAFDTPIVTQLANKSDLMILLAHVEIEESKQIAKAFQDIDIIISGHEREKPVQLPIQVGNCVILNYGMKGQYLGKLEVLFGKTVVQRNHEIIALSEKIPDSPLMTSLLALYQETLKAENLIENAPRKQPQQGGVYVGGASCKDCHASEYAVWEKSKHNLSYATLVEKKRQFDPEWYLQLPKILDNLRQLSF